MSDVFALDEQGARSLEDEARANPLDPSKMPVPLWEGAGAQFNRLLTGSASAGRTVLMAGAPFAIGLDKTRTALRDMSDEAQRLYMSRYGFAPPVAKKPDEAGAQEWYFSNVVEGIGQSAVDYWTPDAKTTGAAANTLGTLFDVAGRLPQIIGTPELFLADAALAPGVDVTRAGGSTEAALGTAGVSLAANAFGMRLPAAIGKGLATRVASGASINVGVGMAQNAATQQILRADGMDEYAAAYSPLAPQALTLDALMGAAFGWRAHVEARHSPLSPSQRNAVLAANNADRFANATMPGHPKTPDAAVQHQDDLGAAIASVLNGERPNPKGDLSNFVLRPELRRAPEIKSYDRFLVALESGGKADAEARTSTAVGPHQFTQSTWLNTVKRAAPAWAKGMDDAALLALRKDPVKSAEMERALRTENAAVLEGAGQEVNALNLYAMHHFGGNGVKFAKAGGEVPMRNILSAEQIKANPYLADLTKAGAIHNWVQRAAKAGAISPKDFRAGRQQFDVESSNARAQQEIAALEIDAPVRSGLAAEFEAAARNKQVFDDGVMQIAEDLGLSRAPLLPDTLKGVSRALEKTVAYYSNDATRLRDLVRGTIVVDNIGQVDAAIEAVRRTFGEPSKFRNTLRDDGMAASGAGYRDVNINVVIGGRNVELQINTPEMLAAKDKAHALYEQQREIEANANKAGRETTPKEDAEIDRLFQEQRSIYLPAWEAMLRAAGPSKGEGAPSIQARKSASGMNDPLRLNEEAGKIRPPSTSQAVQRASGDFVTGTSSTSANSVPAGKVAGSSEGLRTAFMLDSSGGSVSRPLDSGDFPVLGNVSQVVTERGLRLPVRWAVVDVRDLVASHDDALNVNPAFPSALQPRDRTRAASEQQITRIANNLNPELLADSPKAADGAPIVGQDKVVESGNARTIALRRAYATGKADGYRGFLADNAARFGIEPAELDAVEQPALVRVTLENYNRAEFARQANESTTASMSATEQAMADAKRMPDMGELHANDDGTINMRASMKFVHGFIESVGPNERGAMSTAGGELSQQGQNRIRAAVFARAYGDADLVAMMAEATDANVKSVLAGMLRGALAIARLREMIAEGGRFGPDITPDLVMAARKFSQLRSEGITVERFEAQGDFFGEGGLTPRARDLLRTINENARAPRRMAEFLQRYVDAVEALGDPRQVDLMGGQGGDANAALARAAKAQRATQEEPAPQGTGLFGAPTEAITARTTITPENRAAYEAIAAMPDLHIVGDDGIAHPASEFLAEGEADAARAAEAARAVEAAANCFLRNAA